LQKVEFDAIVQSTLEISIEIFSIASTKKDAELKPVIVQEAIIEEEREALVQYVIEVSLQGSNVVISLDTVKTNPGVAPLHPRPITTKDEAFVDALLAQPMLEVDIQD